MYRYKAVPALKQLFHLKILLLFLSEWMSPTEAQECRQLLPLAKLNADAVVLGKIVQHRADEQSIDITIVNVLNGTLLSSKDCWQPLGTSQTLTISTSTLPEECSRMNEKWTVGEPYIISLSARSATTCPSLLYDGLHSPILPAYLSEERVRIRRQNTICKCYVRSTECNFVIRAAGRASA